MRPADHAPDAIRPPAPVDDEDFKKLVAILRCAVPYTGMILSTRESAEMRRQLLNLGVSQMSAGSKTEVGSYHKGDVGAEAKIKQQFESEEGDDTKAKKQSGQFELQDERSTEEIVRDLMEMGFLPSWCTACYRLGRTGEAFMKIAKKGDIQNYCHPNSLLTLQGTTHATQSVHQSLYGRSHMSAYAEYLKDYASDETQHLGKSVIERERQTISDRAKKALDRKMKRIDAGERDLYF
jgi:2-iminoacetate synthase